MTKRPNYISTAEISEKLGVCRATVTRLIHSGKIPALDLGSGTNRCQFRILREDFEKFMEEARVRKPKRRKKEK